MNEETPQETPEKKNPDWSTLGIRSETKKILDQQIEEITAELGVKPTFDELILMMAKALQEKRKPQNATEVKQ
jgi:hypothetical protein